MTSGKRWNILNDIKQTLETITTSNGYTNQIKYVTTDPIDYDEIDDSQIPYVILDDTRNSIEDMLLSLSNDIEEDYNVDIKVIYRASNNLSLNMNGMIGDIKKAIFKDRGRSSNVDSTFIDRVNCRKTEKKNTIEITFETRMNYIYGSSAP